VQLLEKQLMGYFKLNYMKIKHWQDNKAVTIHNPSLRHARKYGEEVQL
jgi:hypothetical protein